MTQQDRTDKALELLRDLPAEVTVEEVGQMVTLFPLLQPTTSWYSHINLNSILMTSAGTLIVAGIAYFAATGNTEQPIATVAEPVTGSPEEVIEQPTEEAAQWPAQPVDREPVLPMLKAEPGLVIKEEPKPEPIEPLAEAAPTEDIVELEAPEELTVIVEVDPPTPKNAEVAPMMEKGSNKKYDHTGFSGVKVQGPIEVVIAQGPFSVNAEGDAEVLENLMISVNNGTLVIAGGGKKSSGSSSKESDKNKNCKQVCEVSVAVQVSMPDLQRVELFGPGDIHITDFNNLSSMDLDLQGSGDIHFSSFKGLNKLAIALAGSGDIHGEEAEVNGTTKISVAGSGDVRIAGRTDKVDISVIGSGDVEASELEANGGEVHVTGSGDVILNSRGATTSEVMGSGEVHNIGTSGSGPRID